MIILALDLGSTCTKATKTAATMLDTDTGEIRRTKCQTSPADLVGLLDAYRPQRVVLEQTNGTGWVVDCLRGADVQDIQVVNTRDAAWRNRTSKTDRNDADLLARLSATGQLRTVHVPARDIREWRGLIDYRHQLVRRRTRIKNHIKSLVRNQGLPTGKLWSTEGLERLAKLAKPIGSCPLDELWTGELATELTMLAEVGSHLAAVTTRLDGLVNRSPMATQLADLPGIGPRTAEIVVATLDDPTRFATRKQVGAYFGAVPKVSQSGGSSRHGKITKAGDGLARAMLTQVVQSARRRKSGWIYDIYSKLLHPKEKNTNRAVQATVRRVVVILWAKCRDRRRAHPCEPLLPSLLAA